MTHKVVDLEESTVEDSTDDEVQQETDEAPNLESELQETQAEQEQSEAKFRGMDPDQLWDSYQNLERKMSQQGQELGQIRQLADTLIQSQARPKEEEIDFFDDPSAAVRREIESNSYLKSIEEQAKRMQAMSARSELLRRHNDYEEIDKSPEFSKWLESSKARQKLYLDASQNLDVDIADELMSMFKDSKARQSTEAEKLDSERKETLKSVKSESGTSGSAATKKIFRRADLLKLQIQDPDRYDQMQDEILLAYAEGRVK